jgi:hypothetical protein
VSERDFVAIMDLDKRAEFEDKVFRLISSLSSKFHTTPSQLTLRGSTCAERVFDLSAMSYLTDKQYLFDEQVAQHEAGV